MWNEDIDLSEYELWQNGMTVAEGDRSVTLSGWQLGFCIIPNRDPALRVLPHHAVPRLWRDRIFVNINLKCSGVT